MICSILLYKGGQVRITRFLCRPYDHEGVPQSETYSLQGASLVALGAFATAWAVQCVIVDLDIVRSWTVMQLIPFACAVLSLSLVLYAHVCRLRFEQTQDFARLQVSEFATSAHTFESAAVAALKFVQEVEVVSRGYGL